MSSRHARIGCEEGRVDARCAFGHGPTCAIALHGFHKRTRNMDVTLTMPEGSREGGGSGCTGLH